MVKGKQKRVNEIFLQLEKYHRQGLVDVAAAMAAAEPTILKIQGFQTVSDNDEPQLVAKLRAAIVDSGLTHYRIAKDAGVTADIVSRFVSGERQLKIETAGRIAEVLGLELVARSRNRKRAK